MRNEQCTLIDTKADLVLSNLLALLDAAETTGRRRTAKSVSHSPHNLFTPIFRHYIRSPGSPHRPRGSLASASVPLYVTVTAQRAAAASTYENKSVDEPRRLAPRNLQARVQTTRKILIVLSTPYFSIRTHTSVQARVSLFFKTRFYEGDNFHPYKFESLLFFVVLNFFLFTHILIIGKRIHCQTIAIVSQVTKQKMAEAIRNYKTPKL